MQSLPSVLLKSIYGGTLIDLVSAGYLEWKCSLFFAEEVVFYGNSWNGLIFLQLCCVSVL